jgi:hypothetical protein
VELIDKNRSMMARRKILASQPPGSQLVEQAVRPIKSKSISLIALSLRQQYDLRRQFRNKSYIKKRTRF